MNRQRFRDSFINTYGLQQWDAFQDPEKGPEGGNAELALITKTDLEEMAKADIRVEGKKAFFSIPNKSREMVMVKGADGWHIEASSFIPLGAEAGAFSKLMNEFALIVGKYQKAIGHKGITGEDIDAELGGAMARAMFGFSTAGKHRFDIDAIK